MEYKETELNQVSDESVSNSRSRVDLNNLIRKGKRRGKKSKKAKHCTFSSSSFCSCSFWNNTYIVNYLSTAL